MNEREIAMQEKNVQPAGNTEIENEIDLMELFYRLLDHWKLIVLCVVLGGILSFLGTRFLITPKYESSAEIYVLSSSDSVVNLSDLQLGSYLASDYIEVFNTHEVNETVIKNLALPYKYDELLKMTSVSNISGTRILKITAETESAQQSADIANEFSTVASDYIADVMMTDRPTVLSVAVAPEKPSSPSLVKNTALGAIFCGIIAILGLVISALTDNKVKSMDDLQKMTGVPVFAQIPETDLSGQIELTKENNEAKTPAKEGENK